MTQKNPWEPDFTPLTQAELREVDQKVDEEVSKIDLVGWAAGLMAVGMLMAIWERLGKPVKKNLDALAETTIRRDHVYGRVRPAGALAQIDNIEDVLPFNREAKNALKFATQHAGEHLQKISDDTRAAVRLALVRAQREGLHPKELAAQLRNTFQGLDRDWRRVAVTESASIAANGYIMSQGEGQMVMGQSSVDCCHWCRDMIHGKIYVVTHAPPASLTDKKWESHVWVGKSNVSRVRHARTSDGKVRVSKDLWAPCIPMHPHCRCKWVAYNPKFHEVDQHGFLKVK